MNKTAGTVILLLLSQTASLFAAETVVKLSGKVTNSQGAALQGATLSVKGVAGLSVASGPDGKFLLASGSAGLQGKRTGMSLVKLDVEGASLVLSLDATVRDGRIDVFSANGDRIRSHRFSAGAPSTRRLAFEEFAPGLNAVRIVMDGVSYSRSLLRLDRTLHLKDAANGSLDGAAPHLARAFATTTIDTLVVKKTGYKDKHAAISSYIDSNLVVAMDSLATCPAPKAGTSKSNPIFTDVFSADPGVMVDNCTFYIQAGRDEGTGGFVMREWYLFKSKDMVNWTRTIPMSLKTFAWTNANAWAGQMIKARNGKYYWYVPINDIKFSKDRMAIGVAVADSPEGPWKDALGKPLVNDSVEMATWNITNIDQTPHTIDPTVFIDDDGQAYLQYGGFWTMVSVKLNPDMISLGSKLVRSTPLDYFESPYLIKRNGLYYQIYARGAANPTTIDYATSTNPQGPWTWRGQILSKMPKVAGQDETTNHAGVAEFAGQWYIVYHVSNGPNGGGTYKRMVAIDKMFFNADGTIKPVTPSAALSF